MLAYEHELRTMFDIKRAEAITRLKCCLCWNSRGENYILYLILFYFLGKIIADNVNVKNMDLLPYILIVEFES